MQKKFTIYSFSIFWAFICNLSFIVVSAQSRDVPFTLEDRDRIIQMQITIDERFKSIDTRFELQQKQIDFKFDSLQNLFYWAFGILVTLILFVLGFIIWDRRTAMEPLRERGDSLIQTLREYAKEQPKLADILRSHGLM